MQRLVFILAIYISSFCAEAGTASISGSVLSMTNSPLARVSVLLRRIPKLLPATRPGGTPHEMAPGEESHSEVLTTDNSGVFSAAGLAAGEYYICATPKQPGLLDGCQWDPVRVFSLLDGQALSGLQIPLRSARTLTITVADPNHVIPNQSRGGILVTVASSETFGVHAAVSTAQSPSSQMFSIPIPLDKRCIIRIVTRGATVVDANGKAIQSINDVALPSIPALGNSLASAQPIGKVFLSEVTPGPSDISAAFSLIPLP